MITSLRFKFTRLVVLKVVLERQLLVGLILIISIRINNGHASKDANN